MKMFESAKEAQKFVNNQPGGKWLVTATIFPDGSGKPTVSASGNPRAWFSDQFKGRRCENVAEVFETLDEALSEAGIPSGAVPQALRDLGVDHIDIGSVWNEGSLLVMVTSHLNQEEAKDICRGNPAVYNFVLFPKDGHFHRWGTQFFVKYDEEQFSAAQWLIACSGGTSPIARL